MGENATVIYRTAEEVTADTLSALTARVPDVNVGEDSIFRIWVEVFASSTEGVYLGQQLLHDDMFIQTANALALQRFGEMFGREQKGGTLATGSVRFAGSGGTYIPLSSVVSVQRPAQGDTLDFITTEAATIPNPGVPDPPVASDGGAGGSLSGTYDFAVSFLTAEGETEISNPSNAIVLAASHKASLASIPLGGPGTTGRRIYRRLNGGTWNFLHDIADNTTTVFGPDSTATGVGTPVSPSTAERVTVTAQADAVGSDYNVAIGTITDLSDVPSGVSEVTNLAVFSGGVDPEDVEAFRAALLKWVRAPQSGSPSDLEVWAESVDGVESATCFTNVDESGTAAPGTSTVRISGPGGSIPDSDVIAAVLAELESHDLANITILVTTFSVHDITTAVTVVLDSTYIITDVQANVDEAVMAYYAAVPVGGKVYKAGIVHSIFGLPGIVSVTVTAPAADVALAATEKAVLNGGAVTIS